VIDKSHVRRPAILLSYNDSGQLVHTHLPLSPSSIIWYWLKGSDALALHWEADHGSGTGSN